ncbi:MAG TPA: hypothetical protein VEC08_00580 [Nitrososphaerales archaeon]|nr:hypothetical protein [Nitrososphaerales archaeon]
MFCYPNGTNAVWIPVTLVTDSALGVPERAVQKITGAGMWEGIKPTAMAMGSQLPTSRMRVSIRGLIRESVEQNAIDGVG